MRTNRSLTDRKCHASSKVALVSCTLVLFAGIAAYPAEIPGLKVTEVAFSRGVVGKNFKKPKLLPDQTRITEGPIFLWTVLAGTQETLNALQNEKFWPVRHKWIFHGAVGRRNPGDVGYGNEEDDPSEGTTKAEELEIGRIKNRAGLQAEIDSSENHEFDWRTWSYKAWLLPGEYELIVEVLDGPILMMAGNIECKFKFTVW